MLHQSPDAFTKEPRPRKSGSRRKTDRLASFDDYATATFEALQVNMDDAREAHRNMWTTLAVGLSLMAKSPDQCRDISAGLEEDTVELTAKMLQEGAAWYRQAADLIEAAEVRFLSGTARFINEGSIAEGALQAAE